MNYLKIAGAGTFCEGEDGQGEGRIDGRVLFFYFRWRGGSVAVAICTDDENTLSLGAIEAS